MIAKALLMERTLDEGRIDEIVADYVTALPTWPIERGGDAEGRGVANLPTLRNPLPI